MKNKTRPQPRSVDEFALFFRAWPRPPQGGGVSVATAAVSWLPGRPLPALPVASRRQWVCRVRLRLQLRGQRRLQTGFLLPSRRETSRGRVAMQAPRFVGRIRIWVMLNNVKCLRATTVASQ